MKSPAVFLAVLAFVVMRPIVSSACMCLGQNAHPCEFLTVADVAIVATAVGVTHDTVRNQSIRRYRFAVSRVFKGDTAGEVEVIVSSDRSSCGVRFSIGERYLVFAFRHDGLFYTNLCAGSRLLSDSTVDLSYLERRDDLRISGRVLDSDRSDDPIGSIRVDVSSETRAWQVTTTEDGLFELVGLTPATYIVRAVSTGTFEPDGSPDTVRLVPGACGKVLQFVRRVRQVDTSSPISFGLIQVEGETVPGSVSALVSQTLQLSPLDDVGHLLSVPIDQGRFRFTIHAGQALKLRVRGVDQSGTIHFGPWVELPIERLVLFGTPGTQQITVTGP